MIARLASALSFAVVLGVTAPAHAAATAEIARSDGGATVIRQPDAAAALVNVTLVVTAGLNRQTLAQNGLAALTAQSLLRVPVDGVALEDAIAAHGGTIRFTVDPQDVRFSIETLPTDASTVFGYVERAFSQPAFTPATVRDARSVLLREIGRDQQLALVVGLQMLNSSTSQNANAGLPSLGIPASLVQLGPQDVSAFFQSYYRRGGAFVSTAGRVDSLPATALDTLAGLFPPGSTAPVKAPLPSLSGTSHEIVAHRDVASPWLIARYSAPALGSRDFGAMLVLSAFMQRTLADIAEMPGVVSQNVTSRAVGTIYDYDRDPATLTLYVNGGIPNPNRAFATALSVAGILAATKLQGSIDQFKVMAAGDFATNSTTLESRAWLAVLFARDGTSPDYANRALTAISGVTANDLQRVARTYLGSPTIALVLPRDGVTQTQ